MQEIIINYYPPVIRQIEEIQQIARAEDIEFSKLKALTNETISNMFISTANKNGILKFEQLFGIVPKATQSLEERRAAVMFRTNQRKMSLTELKALLSEYFQGVEFYLDVNKMELLISVGIDSGRIEITRSMIDEILPLNIFFMYGYRCSYEVSIYCKNMITFTTEFYPRFNLPVLLLNDTWTLDGSQTLSGYDGFDRIDLYPVQMEMRTGVRATPKEETGITFLSDVMENVESSQVIEVKTSAECRADTEESFTIQTSVYVHTEAGGILIDNLNSLDDEWLLDGSRELNGGIDVR